MGRFGLTSLVLLSLSLPAAADSPISAEIGANGLAPTAARLAALPAPTDAERFAMGALGFLGTVERALQTRWRVGIADSMQILPFLRLSVPENPAPQPFEPSMIAGIFQDAAADLEAARAALSGISEGADFGLEIALDDLWFDIDASGSRDPGETLAEVAGPALLGWRWSEMSAAGTLPMSVIRFDAADAAWLTAYTHFLSGVSEAVLAYDPTAAIDRVLNARAQMRLLRRSPSSDFDFDASFGEFVDMFAMVAGALDQAPDAARIRAAQAHFLAMVAENRRFWTLVDAETDNVQEWIPNDRQNSGLGMEMPKDTGTVWGAVLSDAEAMLKGDLLTPYWRGGDGVGINLNLVFTDPRPVDLIGWIQGWGALPYLQEGRVVSSTNWRNFEALMLGDAMLYMVLLN